MKRGIKLKETRHWKAFESDNRHWTDAEPGEVWDLKIDGEWALFVKLTHGNWRSLDREWYIIEGDGDEGIVAGNLTGVEVDVLEY